MTKKERYQVICELREQGLTMQQIGDLLGISASAVSNTFVDPDGSKQRARRERYRGRCEDCGGKTDGSNGHRKTPRYCIRCTRARSKIWTRERIIEALRQFAEEHGRPPVATDFYHTNGRWPSIGAIYGKNNPFRYWADAVEAAGFVRPRRGYKLSDRGYVNVSRESALPSRPISRKTKIKRAREFFRNCEEDA